MQKEEGGRCIWVTNLNGNNHLIPGCSAAKDFAPHATVKSDTAKNFKICPYCTKEILIYRPEK